MLLLVGNLLNRTLGLLRKNCQSTLVVDSSVAAKGTTLKDNVEKLVKICIKFLITYPCMKGTVSTKFEASTDGSLMSWLYNE